MTDIPASTHELPPFGVALWLLQGGTLVDRVDWVIRHQFTGVSLLQSAMEYDRGEAEEAAAAIRDAGLNVTYHGNAQHRLTPDGKLDYGFIDAIGDDVLWWHAKTRGVRSCCSDAIHTMVDGTTAFAAALNHEMQALLTARLSPYGIRTGLENSFGGAHCYRTAADIARFAADAGTPTPGILLDAGHANIHVRRDGVAGEEEIGAYVCALPLDILEVHLSDNHGERDEHLPLGTGLLDLHSLFTALRTVGFHGQLTLEVCRDSNGRFSLDVTAPGDTAPLLCSRDAVWSAWAQTASR